MAGTGRPGQGDGGAGTRLRASRRGAAGVAVFGSVFLLAGLWVLLVVAPRAFREGDAEARLAAAVVGLVFTAAGAGIVGLGLHVRRVIGEREALVRRRPDSPWLWNPEWAHREIAGSGRATMLLAWVFAFFWNAISWPLLPKILAEAHRTTWAAAFAMLFPAVGLGLLAWAVRETLRFRRHGRLVFEPTTLPGVIGGSLEGVVHLSRRVVPEAGFDLQLDCVERTRSGSNDTTERILWQEKDRVDAHRVLPGPRGSDVPVRFRIPWGEAPTDEEGRRAILWRLTISAELPGVDLRSHFVVPVFVTPDSDETIAGPETGPPGEIEVGLEEALEGGRAALPASKARVCALPGGGMELWLGAARNPGPAAAITAFAAVWTGIVVLLTRLDAPLFFSVVFGLVDLLVLAAALQLWTGTTRVRIRDGVLSATRRILGIGWTTRIDAQRIEKVAVSVGMQSGQKVYYRLRAHARDGRPVGCGGGIPDKREAEALAALLERALRATPPLRGARARDQDASGLSGNGR